MLFFFRVLRCFLEFMATLLVCLCLKFAWHLHTLPEKSEATLTRILETGILSVVLHRTLPAGSTSSPIPMSFEYDLVKTFAEQMNLQLDIQIADSIPAMEEMLVNGTAHIAIPGMPVIERPDISFSLPYMHMRYAAIVHRNNTEIQTLEDLQGMKAYFPAETQIPSPLRTLLAKGQLGIMEDVSHSEALFRKISTKEISLAIIPDYMARRFQRYYPQASPALTLGEPGPLVWMMSAQAHKLRYHVNHFLEKKMEDGLLDILMKHHDDDGNLLNHIDFIRFHERLQTRLPRYQGFIKKYAAVHNFDWRLIAAQAYQESHLNPWARSHANARGLMQIMERTAQILNLSNIHDPAQNIEAGIRYLKKLHDIFDEAEEPHRTYIALGAYNVGQGHMLDARNLARRLNLDPDRWYNLEKTLPMLEQKKYYKDATYGYCRGSEPIMYLRKILLYYDILRHKDLLESRKLPPE